MPDSGRGVGKTDEFYAVANSIGNKDWNEFARKESCLGLAGSIIDNIKHDYPHSILEQKYQMLCKWEAKLGSRATVEYLKQLRDGFLGRVPQQQPAQEIPSIPDEAPAPADIRSNERTFRFLLMNIGQETTEADFRCMRQLLPLPAGCSQPTTAALYLVTLENEEMWGRTLQDKLTALKILLSSIDRPDLVGKVDEHVRAFDDRSNPPTAQANITGHSGASSASRHPPNNRQHPGTNGSSSTSISDSVLVDSNVISSRENVSISYGSRRREDRNLAATRTNQRTERVDGRSTTTISGSSLFDSNVVSSEGDVSISYGSHSGGDCEPDAFAEQTPQQQESSRTFEDSVGDQTSACSSTDLPAVPTNLGADICSYKGSQVHVKRATHANYTKHLRTDDIYEISSSVKGHALIINNINFPGWGAAYKRVGSAKDCQLMEKLFGENGLGLTTLVHQDLKRDVMWNTLKTFSENPNHANAAMCVVIIMSHGQHREGEGDAIYASDVKYILADDVVRLFDNDNCPHLRNKPKMFFFQFCRGDAADQGVLHDSGDHADVYPTGPPPRIAESLRKMLPEQDATDGVVNLPRRSDVLIAFATQQGDLSFRSWFTSAIAHVFSEKAHKDHVCDMLKEVKRGLARRESNNPDYPHLHQCKEMADVRDILLKNVYFFPGFP